MKEREIEPGTPEINKKYSIVVDKKALTWYMGVHL